MKWPQEMLDRLRALAKTAMSYEAIAQQMTGEFKVWLSKNSVIGMGRRIGLAQRNPRAKRRPRGLAKPPAPPKTKRRKLRAIMRHHRKPRGVIYVQDLLPDDCRWPSGDWHPYTFCGLPKIEGSAYCKDHTALARGHR